MIYDRLWEIANSTLTVEFKALALGALVVAAVLIWNGNRISKRMRTIETQLRRIEKKVNILEMQESRRLMRVVMELQAKPRVKIDPCDTPAEMGGGDATGLTASPPTAPGKLESEKSAEVPGQ